MPVTDAPGGADGVADLPGTGLAAAPAMPRSLPWRMADVLDVVPETPQARTLVLRVPGWPGHLPGQHLDVRLTAEDGYQAQRSYSIASPPEAADVALTVDRIEGGEVSPYLVCEMRAGDRFEVRGPVGGYFTWTVAEGGPLLLVAGGSGIVPLMAMLRHRAAAGAAGAVVPTRLLASWRSAEDIIYRAELDRLATAESGPVVAHALTRSHPEDWMGYGRRIDTAILSEFGFPSSERPRVFVCGPTALVESVAAALVALGHDPARIKTERFGYGGG